jgi:hypothetical protein
MHLHLHLHHTQAPQQASSPKQALSTRLLPYAPIRPRHHEQPRPGPNTSTQPGPSRPCPHSITTTAKAKPPPPQRQNLHHHHPLLDTPTHTPLLSLCQPTRSSTRSRAQRNLSHRRTAKHSTARRSSLGCNCQYIAVLRCHCCCCRIALVRYRVVPEFPFTPLSCTRFPTLRASAPALDVSRASSCAF